MWPQQTLASVKAASEDHFILSLAFLTFLHFHSLSLWAWHYFYFDTPMPSYALEAPEFRDMLAVLKWSCTAINRFWRTIYGSWIWLPQDVATQVVSDGWAFLESWNTDLEHTDFKIAQADDKCVQMFKWQIWTWKVWTWGDHTFFTTVLNILTFFRFSNLNHKDGYSTLASLTAKAGILGYQIRPKLHMMAHLLFLDFFKHFVCGFGFGTPKTCGNQNGGAFWVWRNLRLDMQTVLACGAQHVLNCSVHSTWTDEDFIGRISRISRRSHVLTAARNTLQRALGHYRRQFGSFFDPVYLRDS